MKRFPKNGFMFGLTLLLVLATWNIMKFFVHPDSSLSTQSVVASPQTFHLNPVHDSLKRVESSFVLTNSGSTPKKILHVEPSCNCTVIKSFDNYTLAPGGSIKVPFGVDLPQYGTKHTNIKVFVEGATSPLLVELIIGGALKLPTFGTIPELNITFLDLDFPFEDRSFSIQSFETINSSPWVVGVSSDLSELNFLVSVQSEIVDIEHSYTKRNYLIQCKWGAAPQKEDFYSKLVLNTSDSKQFVIGSVSGNLRH